MTGARPAPERRAPEAPRRPQARPAAARPPTAGGGVPLPAGVRTFMEGRFDQDFSAVRVHPSSRPPDTAGVTPLAWTPGPDVHLAPHASGPDTVGGLTLMAHELAHVVQQDGASRDDDHGRPEPVTDEWAEGEARATSTGVFDPSVPVVRPTARHRGVALSTGWAVLGGPAGAVVGGLVGALAGPLGAVVGAAAGAALGAWVAGSLTSTGRGTGEGTARQRIHQLLERTPTDWVVTDEDAAAARGILLALDKSDPVGLFQVVQAMKLGDDRLTLRAELAPDLQQTSSALATTSPVTVWTREYMVVIRGEVMAQVEKETDAAAAKRRDAALERASEKFGEALQLAEGRKWAAQLAKALAEGRLRGRAYSTEVVKGAVGATTVIEEWVDETRKVLLVP